MISVTIGLAISPGSSRADQKVDVVELARSVDPLAQTPFGAALTAALGPTFLSPPSSDATIIRFLDHTGAMSGLLASITASAEEKPAIAASTVSVNAPATTILNSSGWRLLYVDSEATGCGNYGAANSFDGNAATMWITEWCKSAPSTPHEIQIDLGDIYTISGFQYLPRQDGGSNGNVANYEFYVSSDGVNWGTAVSTGTLMAGASDKTQKQVTFTGVLGKYIRFRAMSEVHGGPWTAVAELNVLGTQVATSGPQVGSLTLNPATIAGGGATSTATVTLTSAPLTNATVILASSNPAATVPETVTVAAGNTTATFLVTSAAIANTTALALINSTYNNSSGAAVLMVTPGTGAAVGFLPRDRWRIAYVDSEAADCGNYGAANVFDGNAATMWITEWCKSAPSTPHEIQIDLGDIYTISGFQYLSRQDGGTNGDVANYEFYVSTDGVNWGAAVASGTLIATPSDVTQKQVTFTGVVGRYVRFRAMSEVLGGPWTAVAELNVLGTQVATSGPQVGSLTLNPTSIAGGGITSTATVTLTSAPITNATVTLASSNPVATVPETVTVAAGNTTATFLVTSAAMVNTTALALINATYNNSSGAAVLMVTPGTGAAVGLLSRDRWRIAYVDSQATDCGNYGASNAIDGNPTTMWSTEWCHGSPATPHEIQIDLGASYTIAGFQYLPRQDGGTNGDVANYEFYVSTDGVNWGAAVASGTLIATPSDVTQKQVTFTGVVGRYVRFRAMSEVHGGPWTAVAELNVLSLPCSPAFGSFGVGNWPPACYLPYAPTAWITKPLPPNPQVASNSADLVAAFLSHGPAQEHEVAALGVTHADYDHPIYWSTASDPPYTIAGCGYSGNLNGVTFHAPTGMQPGGGSDGHVTVMDQSSGTEYDFWQATINDSTHTIGGHACGRLSINGDARIACCGTVDGDGANAADTGLYSGQIRGVELFAGVINHAIAVVVSCTNGTHVFPAAGNALGGCPDDPADGQWFQLTYSDAEIDALPVPTWKKTVLHAMHQYGFYIDDTGSYAHVFWPHFESGKTYQAFGVEDPFVTYAQTHLGQDITYWGGIYYYDFSNGVDWTRIQVINPCVIQGTC